MGAGPASSLQTPTSRNAPSCSSTLRSSRRTSSQAAIEGDVSITNARSNARAAPGFRTGNQRSTSAAMRTVASSSRTESLGSGTRIVKGRSARPIPSGSRSAAGRATRIGTPGPRPSSRVAGGRSLDLPGGARQPHLR